MTRIPGLGRRGWLPAFRHVTLFKTAYACGLRRNETRIRACWAYVSEQRVASPSDWGKARLHRRRRPAGSAGLTVGSDRLS